MVASQVIQVEPKYGVGLCHNVVIAIIQGDMDPAELRRLGEAYTSLIETYPKGIAAITVLRGSLTVGSKETNAEAQRMLGRLRGSMLHIAVVIENRGFIAQLLRAVIRTLNSVGRGTRVSIATDTDEATHVIAAHVVTRDSRTTQQVKQELLQAIETVAGAMAPSVRPGE